MKNNPFLQPATDAFYHLRKESIQNYFSIEIYLQLEYYRMV